MVDTPNDFGHQTPRENVLPPQEPLSPGRPGYHNVAGHIHLESENTRTEAEDAAAKDRFFGWKGGPMSRMTFIFQKAQIHAKHADMEKAELLFLFLKALKGYSMLLGPTPEDVTEVAIAVVSFSN